MKLTALYLIGMYFFEITQDHDPTLGLANRFVIIIITILIALLMRVILMRYMNRWMMSSSKKVSMNDDSIAEVAHKTPLSFQVLDNESDFSETSSSRETIVARAKRNMNRQLKVDLLVILVYIIGGLMFYIDAFDTLIGLRTEEYDLIHLEEGMSFFLYVVLFLIWVIMRYVGFRHQFKAYQKGMFRLISPLWKMIFAIFQSRWYILLAIVVILSAFWRSFFPMVFGIFSEGVMLFIPVVFHLYMIVRMRKKAKEIPNLKLLILRVFLIDKTSLFTFSRLAKFWKHFGSYFTVSDPSFYRVYWKRKFNHKFPVFIVIIFLIYTQLENSMADSGGESPFVPFMFLLFLGTLVFMIYSVRRMKMNFISHEKKLEKDLRKLELYPLSLDRTFKEKPVSCYDNTWKMTVEKLLNAADVVLMDLRGLSDKNKGCEYEVNLILNKVPLDKILFLGYSDAISSIESLVADKFATLEKDTPNTKLSNPVASIYVVQKENNKETQQIMDVLIQKAGI